jgi:hypothetical protein
VAVVLLAVGLSEAGLSAAMLMWIAGIFAAAAGGSGRLCHAS